MIYEIGRYLNLSGNNDSCKQNLPILTNYELLIQSIEVKIQLSLRIGKLKFSNHKQIFIYII